MDSEMGPPARPQMVKSSTNGTGSDSDVAQSGLLPSETGRDGPPPHKRIKVGARASIACEICRKRKVRCSADYPTCTFCNHRKLTCVYDGHPDMAGPRSAGPDDSPRPLWAPELPSQDLLKEAVKAFFEHYAEEGIFTFFHRPTITKRIEMDTASTETLLCLLAVSARFCPSLRLLKGNPSATSQFYADQALQLIQRTPNEISLNRLHSYLLLGLHECTENDMSKGWLHIGLALRMAQLLRLGFLDESDPGEEELDSREVRNWKGEPIVQATPPHRSGDLPLSSPVVRTPGSNAPSSVATAQILQEEIKRRTWWSCFLLERLFCDGRALPAVLRAHDVTTRFPCADSDFAVGRRGAGARFQGPSEPWGPIASGGLTEGELEPKPARSGGDAETTRTPPAIQTPRGRRPTLSSSVNVSEPDADLYGQMMRVADLWAAVRSYVASGGRNRDRRAPWLEGSTFHKLDRRLSAWDEDLPEHLQYSEKNLTAHSMIGQGKLYGLMHLLYFTAVMYLHRDYIPFIPPIDYDPANGPVDCEPVWFPADVDPTPPPAGDRPDSTWWAESAATCFRAAHAITDLYISLRSRGSELTNPFAGFAVLTAGTMHVHLCFWPKSAPPEYDASSGNEYLTSDTRILNDMRQYWSAADSWCQALNTSYGLNSLIHDRSASGAQSTITQPLHLVRQGLMTIIRMREPDADLVSSPPPTAGMEITDANSSPTVAAAAALVGVGIGASGALTAPASSMSQLDPSLRPIPKEPSGHGHQRRTTTMGSLGFGSGGEVNFWDLNEVLRKKHDLFEGLTPPAGGADWGLGGSGTSTGGGGTYSSLGVDRPTSAMGGFSGLGAFNAFDTTANGSTATSSGAWNEIALPRDWSALSLLPNTFFSPFSPNLGPTNAGGANVAATGAGASGSGGAAATGGYGSGLESWFTSAWQS